MNLPVHQFCPFHLVLLLDTTKQSLALSSWHLPFGYLYTRMKSLSVLSSRDWSGPAPSACTCKEDAPEPSSSFFLFKGKPPFQYSFALFLWVRNLLELVLSLTNTKKAFSNFDFSVFSVTRIPLHLVTGPHYHLFSFCYWCIWKSPSSCPWHPWPHLITHRPWPSSSHFFLLFLYSGGLILLPSFIHLHGSLALFVYFLLKKICFEIG